MNITALSPLRPIRLLAAAMFTALIVTSCHGVDDERIPYADVRLTFNTVGDWDIYGVAGACQAKRFRYNPLHPADRSTLPPGYHYSIGDRTGYGGLLLARDALGDLVVYDMCCPVEVNPTVYIGVAAGDSYARCPSCGSAYDIYTNHGNPHSGPAAERGYALRRYSAIWGGGLPYLTVTR